VKPGDLVQVKSPLPEEGKVGIVMGPDQRWMVDPKIRVMFPDGERVIHFTNLRVVK